jgi:hypothetical protein
VEKSKEKLIKNRVNRKIIPSVFFPKEIILSIEKNPKKKKNS